MTQEEKNKLFQFISEMRNETIEKEGKDQLSNKKTEILQRLEDEIPVFKKLIESNNVEAQREKHIGCETWQLYHLGKCDAYGFVISVLKEIIKDYE